MDREEEIKVGDTKEVVIENTGDKITYKFIPETDGNYIFSTEFEEEGPYPIVYLYNEDRTEFLDELWDYGEITTRLSAGKIYYYVVQSEEPGTFSAKLEKSNVKSISYEAVKTEFIENVGGFEYDDGVYCYNVYPRIGDKLTVAYDDSVEEYIYEYINSLDAMFINVSDENDYIYDVEYTDTQTEHPWSIGASDNYYSVKYRGCTYNVPVKVLENPVSSISYEPVASIIVEENTRGYWITDEDDNNIGYYYNNLHDLIFQEGSKLTVNKTDGTSEEYTYTHGERDLFISHDGDVINFYGEYGLDYSYDNQAYKLWSLGADNYITINYMSKECRVPVEIKDSIEYSKDAAQAIVDMVNALPDEITLDNKEAVKEALEAYNKLTPEQIARLDDAMKKTLEAAKAKLDTAQTKIADLEREGEQNEDQAAAQSAIDAINHINMDDPASIEEARKIYDALTPDQQKLLIASIVQALTNAEEEHKADQAAADVVAQAIQNMDTSNPASVIETKKAFDKLTERQKKLIDPALVELLRKAFRAASLIPVKTIKITGISNKIAAGKKVQLTTIATPENATKQSVTWRSSNPKIAKVSQSGLVIISKKAGGKSVKITATATDGSKKQVTYIIKIMKGAVTKVIVKGAKKNLAVNKTMKLKATVKTTKGKANKKIKWTSSNPKYATISSSGKVKALKAGKGKKVKITAMATDGSGKKNVVSIKIK